MISSTPDKRTSGVSGPSRTGEGVPDNVMRGSAYGGKVYVCSDMDRGQAIIGVGSPLLIQ